MKKPTETSLCLIGFLALLAGTALAQEGEEPVLLGSLNQLTFHPVSGQLYGLGDKKLLLKNFVYDGEGPDVFFLIGLKEGRRKPNLKDGVPLPYFDQSRGLLALDRSRQFSVRDKDFPILGRYDGEDVELQLPGKITVGDLKWFSLYCRDYNVDFGNLFIDKLPAAPSSGSSAELIQVPRTQ